MTAQQYMDHTEPSGIKVFNTILELNNKQQADSVESRLASSLTPNTS